MSKKLLFITALLLLAGFTGTIIVAGIQDFILENQTGLTIRELYIKPYHSNDWEENVLEGDLLDDGEILEITFEPRQESYWDIMIVDADGNRYYWRKFNLKEVSKIVMFYDGDEVWAEYE